MRDVLAKAFRQLESVDDPINKNTKQTDKVSVSKDIKDPWNGILEAHVSKRDGANDQLKVVVKDLREMKDADEARSAEAVSWEEDVYCLSCHKKIE